MLRIITDSTCESPPGALAHPAVTILPLTVVFGQTALRDGVDISHAEFWARLPQSNPLPTTSQAVPADYSDLLDKIVPGGDEVIILTLSSKLSGTYSSAVIAAEAYPEAVSVVDSLSTSVGLGMLLQEALAMLDAGATRSQIVARLEAMREKIRIVFVLETLEYLQKGGRIGKAQAFVGTLLKFKPLLGIVDGEVVPLTRVRSRAKALEAVQELLLAQVSARGPQVRMAVTQAVAAEEARAVGQKLAAHLGARDFFVAELGPVLGVHVGPGTIGIGVHPGD